ncbi:MAG: hypothetical protein AMJ53_02240 [Gammaproteobacteria bacterium SG8_11]|nr:MAG: hypothetical protein AMJ53_02240 [Gammaproteobacteria bacterium SG8_11]
MHNKFSSPNSLWPALGILFVAAITLFFTLYKPEKEIGDSQLQPNPVWDGRWIQLQPFNIPRRALAAVTANDYLYVIGGVDQQGNYVREVEFTRILEDGRLAPWKTTSPLEVGRFYLAAVTANGYLYAIGGGAGTLGDENQPVNTVEKAKILPDGSLGPWQSTLALKTPRRGLKALASQSHIYAIGGYNGVFLKSTEHAAISPSGELTPWQIDPQESSMDRYIHSAALYDSYLYVLGGHVQKAVSLGYGDVEMATIQSDGSLSPWTVEQSRLVVPRFIASAFAKDHFLYILGGHNGAQRLNSVEFATITRNGHIGNWQLTTPLNFARSAAAVVTHHDFIYVLGGIGDVQVLNSVEMTKQLINGHLGLYRR